MPPEFASRKRQAFVAALCLVLVVGIFLRLPASLFDKGGAFHALSALHPNPGFAGIGFDEALYRDYVENLTRVGLTSYSDIVDHYIEVQKTLPGSILPPTRFLYIFAAYLWHLAFATEALAALHNVASLFGVLNLLLATAFAWRMKGPSAALGVGALIAFAPTQIHMSQHALVDGFFTFWALLSLWLFWENLRAPRDWRWLVTYTLALALMVTTKENAAFVYAALLALLAANHWLRWGTITRELLACTMLGPLLGFVILVFLAGGLETLRTSYELSISKNFTLPYAIMTGDGPWHRYLVDLLLVSPVVLVLALAAVFRLDLEKKPELFMAVFIGASYLVMCNLKYGMNLRYANMWDMPLRVLAFSALVSLTASLGRYRTAALTGAIALLCALELRQYLILFVQFPLYELVPQGLLRALHILK
jgi:4-amino-4-deoxy-L-arabinose transferase-like glycosyltransferase